MNIKERGHKYYLKHKGRYKKQAKVWGETHPIRRWQIETNYRDNVKRIALTHYGNGKCACVICGFDNIDALTIDHIGGNGNEHRREIRYARIYSWLRKHNYPEGFQTLCENCQAIKEHKQRRENAEKRLLQKTLPNQTPTS